MSDDLLTAKDVAQKLSISENQAKRLSHSDSWPCVRISAKTIRYRPEHVTAIVAMYELEPARKPSLAGQTGQTVASRRRAS